MPSLPIKIEISNTIVQRVIFEKAAKFHPQAPERVGRRRRIYGRRFQTDDHQDQKKKRGKIRNNINWNIVKQRQKLGEIIQKDSWVNQALDQNGKRWLKINK